MDVLVKTKAYSMRKYRVCGFRPWAKTTLSTKDGLIEIKIRQDYENDNNWVVLWYKKGYNEPFVQYDKEEGIFYDTFHEAQKAYSLKKRLFKRKLELGLIEF